MKNKIILSALLLLFFLMGCKQENQYRLNGLIDNQFNGQSIMLFLFEEESIIKVDTVKVIGGTFSFLGTESLNDIGLISLGNYPDTVVSQIVILDKGDIFVDMNKNKVGGSPLNKLYQSYLDSMAYFTNELQILAEADGKANLITANSQRHKKLIEIGEYTHKFKKKNIHNIVGQYFFEKEAGKSFAERFAFPPSESCLDSAFYSIYNAADSAYKQKKWVKDYIQNLEPQLKLTEEQSLLLETQYTDFVLTATKGIKRKISDYIGKSQFTMLEFWASWCGPCIAAFPKLKEIYNKYERSEFEIVGISLDSSVSRWDEALNKIDAPWVQLLSNNRELEIEIKSAYSFKGIPFSVLIDKNGKITATGHSEYIATLVLEMIE